MAVLIIFLLSLVRADLVNVVKDHYSFLEDEKEPVEIPTRTETVAYHAEWDDLDSRPLPEWYDRAKIGIMIHYGVFSVPSFVNEWFWLYWSKEKPAYTEFMADNYPPGFSYQEFAPMLTAEFFDADQWANICAEAGARYVVLTSKHHEGYTLFPSKYSFSWNSMDVGPKRDIVGDLEKAVRKHNMKYGLYYSLYEWFNPLFIHDKENSYTTRLYPETKVWPELKQLINGYKPSILWVDGDWDASVEYWNSTGFLTWLYNESPVKDEVVVNDRWGKTSSCHHGDFYNCHDGFNPGVLQQHKWENVFSIDKTSWGYRRNIKIDELRTAKELLKEIVTTVSCGGNVLINIGPTKEGSIPPIYQERLRTLGKWFLINGEGIYGTSPWKHQNDSLNGDVWYTCIKYVYDALEPLTPPSNEQVKAVFAIVLKWPHHNTLVLKDIMLKPSSKVVLLGNTDMNLVWKFEDGVKRIIFPKKTSVKSEIAWTLKFMDV